MGSVTSLLVDAFMVSRENPSDALQDISIKTRNVNLVLAADKSLFSKISPETYVKVRAAPSILQVVVVTQGLSVYFGKTLKSGLAQRCVENCSVTVSPTSSQVFTSLSDFVSLLLLSVCPLLCDSCSHCITSSAFCTSQL